MPIINALRRGDSVSARMVATRNRSAGFDYLRIGLAVAVVCTHSTAVSYGRAVDVDMWDGPQRMLDHMILPMFFALSGFLVAGSLERCPTLVSFYGLRILRIVPALAVEVTLSAIIFGPLLSSLPLADYIRAPEFRVYFLNIVGYIHYLLPGVFEHNPVPRIVNAQLWTVPFELQCYLAIGALAVVGIVRDRRILLAMVVAGQALWAWQAIRHGHETANGGVTGALLILCFLTGVLFFLYRDKLPLNGILFGVAFALCGGLMMLPRGTFYVPIPATYVTVYLGLLNPRKVPLLFGGDYSYGVYLYGYPIQQVFASLGPWSRHWWLNILVCLPSAFAVAYVSWNVVEKPTLALRRYLPGIEGTLVRLSRRAPARIGVAS